MWNWAGYLWVCILLVICASCNHGGSDNVPIEKIGPGHTGASHQNPRVVFNDAGNGLAVWEVNNGFTAKLDYAMYDAGTDTWSSARPLSVPPSGQWISGVQLATNGNGYMAAWTQSGKILVAINDGLDWSILTEISKPDTFNIFRIDDSGSSQIASNGYGYAIAWMQVEQDALTVYAATFDGAAWSRPMALYDSGSAGDWYFSPPSIASNKSGYAVAWQQFDGNNRSLIASVLEDTDRWTSTVIARFVLLFEHISYPQIASSNSGYAVFWNDLDLGHLSVLTALYNGGWSEPVVISKPGTDNGGSIKISSNDRGYAATWVQNDGGSLNVIGTILEGGTWTAPTNLSSPSDPYVEYSLQITSSDSGYAVVWDQSDLGGLYVMAARYSDGWSEPVAISKPGVVDSTVQIASNGGGYAATWVASDGVVGSLNACVYDSTGWGEAIPIESGSGAVNIGWEFNPPFLTTQGNRYVVVWSQDVGTTSVINVNTYDHSWTGEVSLTTADHIGSSQQPMLASNGPGETLVVWSQFFHGGHNHLYASVHADGTWGNSVTLLEEPHFSSVDPMVASGANGFVVVWETSVTAPGVPDRRVSAAVFADGTWSGPTRLDHPGFTQDAEDVQVASGEEGYAVAWRSDYTRVYATVYDGSAWSEAKALDATAETSAFRHQIVSNGGGYAVVWNTSGDYRRTYASVYENGEWGTAVELSDPAFNAYDASITSSGNGYGMVWQQSDGNTKDIVVTFFEKGAWTARARLDDGIIGEPGVPGIVSNGTGYSVVWPQRTDDSYDMYAVVYENGVPSAADRLSQQSTSIGSARLTSNGTGYAATWQHQGATGYHIYAAIYQDGAWTREQKLSAPGVNGYIDYIHNVVSNADGYAVIWRQFDGNSFNVYAAVFENNNWGTLVKLCTLVKLYGDPAWAGDTQPPTVASDGTGYAVSWIQHDGLHYKLFGAFYRNGGWSAAAELDDRRLASDVDEAVISRVGSHYAVAWTQPDPAEYLPLRYVWARIGL